MPRLRESIEGETKQEHFRRIAQFRVNEIITRLVQMRSFTNREYEFEEGDLMKMFRAIEEELETLKIVLYTRVNDASTKKFIL